MQGGEIQYMLMEVKERNSCSRAVIIGEGKTEAVSITRDFAQGIFLFR